MRVRYILTALAVLSWFAGSAASLHAAGRVQLELVGDARGSALAFQQWLQTLAKAGVKNVRFRSARAGDEVGIDVRGTKQSPLYVVTGIVKSADELLLPAGRFKRRDAARLALWLNDLAKYGPEGGRKSRSAFGLDSEQFALVHKGMARPVGFSTRGLTRSEAVEKIGRLLLLKLQLDPKLAETLATDKVAEELSGLSCGTALAYVLRPMGLCVVPRQLDRGTVCAVVKAQPGLEVWPVGWEPQQPRPKVLPALFEFHNVNIQGVSAATALEAIGKRLKVPVLIDHNALARHGIDPAKAIVSHPGKRTTYSIALRRVLFQARLKFEIRVDESGQPFLWISTVKPV
jgi:hypothetical protein